MQLFNEKGWYPETEPADREILKKNKPDLIGINYCSTVFCAVEPGEDTSKLPPFYRNERFTLGNNPYLTKTK